MASPVKAPVTVIREQKKALKELSAAVSEFIRQLDEVMKEPSTVERGKKIAQLRNALDYANDRVRYFQLGVDYRKDKKP